MVLDRRTGQRQHRMTADLPEILTGPDFRSPDGEAPLLVFNNSRVRKARLRAFPLLSGSVSGGGASGGPSGEAEFLLLNRIDPHTWRVMVNRTKRRRPGNRYRFEGGLEGEIVEAPSPIAASPQAAAVNINGANPVIAGAVVESAVVASAVIASDVVNNAVAANDGGEFRYLRFDSPIDDDWLDIHGHIPLPPYIKRDDEATDNDRYQTIYADRAAGADLGPGASAAAPTAGLHFTEKMFGRFDEAGIERVFVTLHVGLGTFLPVRTEHIEDHVMHEETYSISGDAQRRINEAKARGQKIVTVGTTSLRTLESACCESGAGDKKSVSIKAGEGRTSIFIYPGYRFKMADVLFTNFHTPGSTLLMLVSAFASALPEDCGADTGRQFILESYAEAMREGYTFFSYGDSMLIR